MFKTQRQVQWRDTDAAGIMHFSVFFTYMEEAEHELLRSVSLTVSMTDEEQHISFPRVSAKCDYLRPVRFEDVLDIEVTVARIGDKSITYDVCFKHNSNEVAKGSITAVCCRVDCHPPQSVSIPSGISDKLKSFLK